MESPGIPEEVAAHTDTILFNDLDRTLETISRHRKDLAAVIIEPAMGEGGFVLAHPEYLKALREETRRIGAVLIFDEIITGFRVALGGAQEKLGILPDLVTLGKVAGGGLPIGIIAGRREILEKSSPIGGGPKEGEVLIGGGTFSAGPLAMAVGSTVLSHLKEHGPEVYSQLDGMGEWVRKEIQDAYDQVGFPGQVTGTGSLFQVHLPKTQREVLDSPQAIYRTTDVDTRDGESRLRLVNQGIYSVRGGGALSLAHTDEDLHRIVEAHRSVAMELKAARSN